MIVTAVLLTLMPNKVTMISAMSGVATEKVVAVPASSAKSANKSITRPRRPCECFSPMTGRHASEYLCLSLFLQWSMNPKATARTR